MAKTKTPKTIVNEQVVVASAMQENSADELVDIEMLTLYAENGLNVMLIGDHGVGKTHLALEAFRRAGMKVKYFSASTLDPWVDFLGIPFNKDGHIEMLKPDWLLNDYDAIFLDEFNRAPMKVKNGVMEMIQFQSINGEKLPRLRCVWTAINPYGSNIHQYDVDPMDEAQKDRFHIHIEVPFKVNLSYFRNKYDTNGERACEWWYQLGDDVRKMVSPRRLDYAMHVWHMGGDITHTLPAATVPHKLLNMLTKGSILPSLRIAVAAKDKSRVQSIVVDGNNHDTVVGFCRSEPQHVPFIMECMSKEQQAGFVTENMDMVSELYVKDGHGGPLRTTLVPLLTEMSIPDGEEYNKFRNMIAKKIPQFTHDMLDPNRVPVQILNPGTHGTIEDFADCLAKLTVLPAMETTTESEGWWDALKELQSKVGRDVGNLENLVVVLKGMLVCVGQRFCEPHFVDYPYASDMVMSLFNLLVRLENPTSVDDYIVNLMQDEKFANWNMKAQLANLMSKAAK